MQETKELDIQAIIDELDEEFAEVEDQPDEPVEDGEDILLDDEVADDEGEDILEDSDEVIEEDVDEEESEFDSDDSHKRNEAFRRLRKERDELAASEDFLKDLAKQYGLTKDQLIERFQEDQLKKEAEEQGIPESQLRKVKELEVKLAAVEEEKNKEVFNIKAETLASKYKLNDNQMMTLFEEAAKLDLDILKNPDLLEFAYRAVNYDNAVQEGRQKQLETTKQRSSTSTGRTGTRGSEVKISDEEAWEKEIDAYLKDLKL